MISIYIFFARNSSHSTDTDFMQHKLMFYSLQQSSYTKVTYMLKYKFKSKILNCTLPIVYIFFL